MNQFGAGFRQGTSSGAPRNSPELLLPSSSPKGRLSPHNTTSNLNLPTALAVPLCSRRLLLFQFSLLRCGGLPSLLRCSGDLRIQRIRRAAEFVEGEPARIQREFRSRRREARANRAGFRGLGIFTAPSSIRTDSSARAGSGVDTSNSSSISPTSCSKMSSTVITPAVEPNSSTTTAR